MCISTTGQAGSTPARWPRSGESNRGSIPCRVLRLVRRGLADRKDGHLRCRLRRLHRLDVERLGVLCIGEPPRPAGHWDHGGARWTVDWLAERERLAHVTPPASSPPRHTASWRSSEQGRRAVPSVSISFRSSGRARSSTVEAGPHRSPGRSAVRTRTGSPDRRGIAPTPDCWRDPATSGRPRRRSPRQGWRLA